jgi:alpha-L-fucosidase 2
MILQSHTKLIDILPALPAALPNGEVKGYCARGGFVFNIKWSNGKLQELVVTSNAGQTLLLRYNNKVVNMPTIKNTVYKFDGSLNKL